MPPKKQIAARPEAAPPTLLAFTFNGALPTAYHVTRVAWTPEGYGLVEALSDALYRDYEEKRRLPVRDLRLRTQVYDPGVVRVGTRLGIRVANAGIANYDILFTDTAPAEAAMQANRAVADWVEEAVKKIKGFKPMHKQMAQRLRDFAIRNKAVAAKADEVPVFQWLTNTATDTALPRRLTDFADLADYVAARLVGQVVFPGAGPLRREIGGDLHQGSARLLTEPIEVPMGEEAPCRLSLGVTVRVATYPGRPLPVIIVSMEKRVWTSVPNGRYGGNDLSGFAFPDGVQQAFRFSIDHHKLAVGEDYRAIAAGYPDLPAGEELTGIELARDGWQYRGCRVLVAAAPGRSDVKVAGRGLTAIDRQLAYEQLVELLASGGFAPWGGHLRRLHTGAKTVDNLIGKWNVEHHAEDDEEKAKDRVLMAWTRQLHERLRPYYGGMHRVLIAYQDGLDEDAARVEKVLLRILGPEGIAVTQAMLPADVHGPRVWGPNGEKPAAPAKRAEAKMASWTPWIAAQATHLATTETELPHGVIVLARRRYGMEKDDPISKQVGRVALITGFKGASVQYLLPSAREATKPTAAQERKFNMRAVNGWRDLALKSVGRMLDLPELLAKMPFVQAGNQPPVLLGAGIVRVNQTRARKNKTSFIPYVVELDPLTGECQAALLLRKPGSHSAPELLPMQPLKSALRRLAQHGPSYLAEHDKAAIVLTERQQLTEKFLHDVLLERSAFYESREVVLLADSFTLGGIWQWLADSRVNPADVQLHTAGLQQVLPNVTFVRLRRNHAPKALLPTPRVRVSFEAPDGSYSEPRPAAWGADAKLYRLIDPSVGLPTYLSYGSRFFKAPRGVSSYRGTASSNGGETTTGPPFTKTWATPNALEITVLQDLSRQPATFEPDELAYLVETLRWNYDHFGGWTTLPGPLHFASVLKQYVPDYDLAEVESEEKESEEEATEE